MLRLARIAAISCFVCISVVSLSEAKIDPETAVGVWLFDEGTGNDTKDSSGKGHHGQINGAKWKNGNLAKAWNSTVGSGSRLNQHQNFKQATN